MSLGCAVSLPTPAPFGAVCGDWVWANRRGVGKPLPCERCIGAPVPLVALASIALGTSARRSRAVLAGCHVARAATFPPAPTRRDRVAVLSEVLLPCTRGAGKLVARARLAVTATSSSGPARGGRGGGRGGTAGSGGPPGWSDSGQPTAGDMSMYLRHGSVRQQRSHQHH